MHWGLRAFERKRIERIALDHPYFDMHAPLLTKKELRTILAQGPCKTGPQVVAEVKKELGIAYAPATQKKRTLTEALRDASFVPSFRRTVVLGIFCLLLVLFITFTVPGRAFAEEIYSIIIEFIDGSFGARNNTPKTDKYESDYSILPIGIQEPAVLAALIDSPIIVSGDLLQSFKYEQLGDDVLLIRSMYLSQYGAYIIVQEIYGDSVSWGTSAEFQHDSEYIQADNGMVFYIGSSNDGALTAVSLSEKSIIKVSSHEVSRSDIAYILHTLVEVE